MSVRTPSRERVRTGAAARTGGRGRASTLPAPREGATPARARATQARAPQTEQVAQTASQRAYARREERLRRLVGGTRPDRPAARSGRAKFVLVVMVLLTGGLVATLWLSTAASADSYRLQDAEADAAALSQRSEQLRREVAQLASAPELARRAEEMGMVRVEDPARLVVGADGGVTVVGEPEAATAPAPPAPVLPPATTQPGAPDAAEPDAGNPDGAAAAQGPQGETTTQDGAAGEDGNTAAGTDGPGRVTDQAGRSEQSDRTDRAAGAPAGADAGDAAGGDD
jgi:cell division protein FtsI (penicillin-binding protein 3)